MTTSFYSREELLDLGLKSVGENVRISRKVSIYGAEQISIGDNVRIDDFCILSGKIQLGSHIHISAYCALYGSRGIIMEDYSGISSRVTLYSAMDDFSGDYLIGPIHPEELTNVTGGTVHLQRFVQIGAGCVVFPSVTLGEGSVVGALSLVREDTEAWSVNVGIPAKFQKRRSRKLLDRLNVFSDDVR